MSQRAEETNTGMTRWLRVLLVASLALNLVVIGTIGGTMFARAKWPGHHPQRLDFAGGPLTRALAPDDRRAIGREMRQAYGQDNSRHANLQAGFDGLIADLTATPFDPAAVSQRFVDQRGAFGARLELGQDLLLQRLTQMTVTERAEYAGRLRQVLKDRQDRHRKRQGTGG